MRKYEDVEALKRELNNAIDEMEKFRYILSVEVSVVLDEAKGTRLAWRDFDGVWTVVLEEKGSVPREVRESENVMRAILTTGERIDVANKLVELLEAMMEAEEQIAEAIPKAAAAAKEFADGVAEMMERLRPSGGAV